MNMNPITEQTNLQMTNLDIKEKNISNLALMEPEQDNNPPHNTNPNKQLEHIVAAFLNPELKKNMKSTTYHELEAKFGTRGESITKINFDNVIAKLLSLNFTPREEKGEHRLTIHPQFLDNKLGIFRSSNVRIEVRNMDSIQTYCRENKLDTILNKLYNRDITFINKTSVFVDNKKLFDAVFKDFNFSVSYKHEFKYHKNNVLIANILGDWVNTKKTFRYMKRIRYYHKDYPVVVDMSIVQSSVKEPTYTLDESKTLENQVSYEIEFEIDPDKVGPTSIYNTPKSIIDVIHKVSKFILSGIQKTNYPISISTRNNILNSYLKILYPNTEYKHAYSSNFIGPSSYTLQLYNICPVNENINEPNIRNNFCVTEKADGERHLMFITEDGKIYLINVNMDVLFTGAVTNNEKIFNTIIDGELIIHNKNKEFLNLFLAFDIYFMNGQNIRQHKFIQTGVSETNKNQVYRYSVLRDVFDILNPKSVVLSGDRYSPMKFRVKRFYVPDVNNTIFDCCNTILSNKSLFEYKTDGLIFTHSIFGVGGNHSGKVGPLKKTAWKYSFKWKPPSLNTIDFLVETKKDPSGQDIISTEFQDGEEMVSDNNILQYKTLVLKCGFNEKRDGYINPCLDVIEDKRISYGEEEDAEYKAIQFYPSNPSDSAAGICFMPLKKDNNNVYKMFTDDNQVFEDGTIVEFMFSNEVYDVYGKAQVCWTPLRVRYDKTADYRKALLENKFRGPNSYETANNNWYSINNPVSEEMIKTGENIVMKTYEEEIYYKNGVKSTLLKGLRNFHNLYVKHLLITSVCEPGNTLIDFACGKAGDLPKWIDAKLKFVFGIDTVKDNLENRIDGACARYLNYRKKYVEIPKALFVNGDSSVNVRNGSSMKNELSKKITTAIFGQGEKNEGYLGKAVYDHYGIGKDGFNVSSCQFALHYFFKDPFTVHNFLRNLAECTALNGYFIGTCYDGKTVFNRLKNTGEQGLEYYENGKKVCEIVKNYEDTDTLEDDESCIGKEILVYQESINQTIPEYLVNYDYFKRLMENYGFTPYQKEGIPTSSGMFKELFYKMTGDVKKFKYKEAEYKDALQMTDTEKNISFLNRYFVFKKVRHIEDIDKISMNFISKEVEEPPILPPEVKKLTETIFIEEEPVVKPKRKYTKKVKMVEEEKQMVNEVPMVKEPPMVNELQVKETPLDNEPPIDKEYTDNEILLEVDYILVESHVDKIKLSTIFKELASRLNKKDIKKTHGKLVENYLKNMYKQFTINK